MRRCWQETRKAAEGVRKAAKKIEPFCLYDAICAAYQPRYPWRCFIYLLICITRTCTDMRRRTCAHFSFADHRSVNLHQTSSLCLLFSSFILLVNESYMRVYARVHFQRPRIYERSTLDRASYAILGYSFLDPYEH
jgi:hypothetical protein